MGPRGERDTRRSGGSQGHASKEDFQRWPGVPLVTVRPLLRCDEA